MNSHNRYFHKVIPKTSQVSEGLKGSKAWVTFEPFFKLRQMPLNLKQIVSLFLFSIGFPLVSGLGQGEFIISKLR